MRSKFICAGFSENFFGSGALTLMPDVLRFCFQWRVLSFERYFSMFRSLVLSALTGIACWLHVPALAQKAVIQPEIEILVKAKTQDAVVASLRTDVGLRRSTPIASPKAAPEKNPVRDNFRMLVAALLLMLAIAIRRRRSGSR